MITKLVVENFKAIEKRLEITLPPLAVLVGPNDSGKSTILQAIEIIGRIATSPLHARSDHVVFDQGFEAYLPHADRKRVMRFEAEGNAAFGCYRFTAAFEWRHGGAELIEHSMTVDELAIRVDGIHRAGSPGVVDERGRLHRRVVNLTDRAQALLAELGRELESASVRWDPHRLAAPSPLGVALGRDGTGLACMIDKLASAADREPRNRLEARLRELSPFVASVGTREVATHEGTQKEITYSLAATKHEVAASEMSGGVVLLTAYLWLRFGTNIGRLLIEEPENGLHPRSLPLLGAFFRELAYEDRRQVIIATHSPFLLDNVSPTDVLVVTRHPAHGVFVTPMTETKFFDERSAEFSLGELWFNIGEENLIADAS